MSTDAEILGFAFAIEQLTARAEKAENERDDARAAAVGYQELARRAKAERGDPFPNVSTHQALARAHAAEAALAALRARLDDAPVAWIWTDRVCHSHDEMHALIGGRWGTEDVERVRLVPEREEE